eukprot:TRINITY_DN1003_c0_g1_i12.p1 TRINITY_DN1003_c0_g1~~TRINITY_DN1003_c0_g1_i12.p1  ORF type:complete len:182 (+),score=61.77 TRINITY_DN1003_c0_g1_i12:184-729(+)
MARLSNAVQLFDACAAAIGLRTLLRNFLLLHPHRQGVSNEVLQEYLRFMALKLLLGDTAAPPKLSPPALVAEMWSTHVQDTRAYADFCQALGRGFVHMDPAAAGDAKEARDTRLVRARAMYTHGFGCAPPTQIWGDGSSAGGGGNGGGGGGRLPLPAAAAAASAQYTGVGAARPAQRQSGA